MNKLKNFTIGFRVTTSNIYGKGHLTRCLQLAKELNYKVIFFTDSHYISNKKINSIAECSNFSADKAINALRSHNIEALIFDNYNIFPEIIESAAKLGICAVIDDYKLQWKNPLIFAPNLGSKESHHKYNKNVFAGPEYALISNKFYKASLLNHRFKKNKICSHVLIQMGAIDSKNNIKKVLNALLNSREHIKHITVILNKQAPHRKNIKNLLKSFNSSLLFEVKTVSKMISLYRDHNLIIGAAGVSLLERVSLGIHCLAFSLNKNQDINIKAFDKFKLGINGGRIDKISNSKLQLILHKFIIEDKSQYFSKNSYVNLLDGNGSKRIISIIKEKILKKGSMI